ncbi:MAG: zf-HC2 domain-containing protein [Thermoanaerobaculia bacterium]
MIDESEIARQIPLVADSAAKRTFRCPPSTQLAAYVDARLGEAPRSEVEEHLADCAFCLGQIGFLVRDSRGQAAVPLPADLLSAARDRPIRRFGPVPAPALTAMAATALLLVVAVLWQPDSDISPAQPYLGAPADRTVRNGAVTVTPPRIVLPGDGEIVARPPVEVRWSASPGALQYAVQVLSLEGDLVWEDLTGGEGALIPSEVQLEPGQKYYVWVEAQLRNGGTARSDAVAFRVASD